MKFNTPRGLCEKRGFPPLEKGGVIITRGEYTQKGGLRSTPRGHRRQPVRHSPSRYPPAWVVHHTGNC